MNILIASAVFPPEPVVSSILSFDIAENLGKNGNIVTVICPKPTRPFGYKHDIKDCSNYKFTKIILNSYTCPSSNVIGRFRESISFGLHCYRFIKKNQNKIDIIYANSWPLFSQYYLVKAAHKCNIPVIMHIQDIYPESIAKKQKRIIRWLLLYLLIPFDKCILKKSSKVITISNNMKDYLVKTRQIDISKIFVVRNWQNDSDFINNSQISRKKSTPFIFMFLGSINPSANIDTLIHAYGKAKMENAKLVIAGEGPTKLECIKLAEQYTEVKIEFINAPIDKVCEIQQQADVLLLPLKKGIAKTATPSKLTAYMLSGKPIIACLEVDSDTADVINQADCGWVIPPENIDKLIEIMKTTLLNEPEDMQKKGRNGFEYAIKNLSKKSNLIKIVDIIYSTVNK